MAGGQETPSGLFYCALICQPFVIPCQADHCHRLSRCLSCLGCSLHRVCHPLSCCLLRYRCVIPLIKLSCHVLSQVVYVVLNSALCLGPLLDTAWLPLIALMQQLVAILDLPHPDKLRTSTAAVSRAVPTPTKRSHRRSTSTSSGSGGFLTISASVAAEVPALGAMLAQIFEMCHNLDDSALQHLVAALCQQVRAGILHCAAVFLHFSVMPCHRLCAVSLSLSSPLSHPITSYHPCCSRSAPWISSPAAPVSPTPFFATMPTFLPSFSLRQWAWPIWTVLWCCGRLLLRI